MSAPASQPRRGSASPRTSIVRWRSIADEWRWCALTSITGLALLALFVSVGGDWEWLVALGDHVRTTGEVPDSVPFAAADTSGWHNVPVLAEVLASWLHAAGPRAAVFAHLCAVAVTIALLAVAVRARGGSDAAAAGATALVVVGSLATLGVVRAQTFSLVPFALMVTLVVTQQRRPDSRMWWAVPLVAVWGNLHGAALLGVCVLGAYLLVDRIRVRPLETLAIGATSLAALCLTPQGWRTPLYYVQVFDNVSAQRAEGLWARPSVGDPFDVMMLAAVVLLLVGLLRTRRAPWEYVAALGLVAATASAGRNGVWLLFLLAVLAGGQGVRRSRAEASGDGDHRGAPGSRRSSLAAVVVLVVLSTALAAPVAGSRGTAVLGAHPDLVARVASLAGTTGDTVVLAPAPLSEALAVAGVRLWVSNPLDAFRHADQAAYLDFLDGVSGAQRAVDASDVVVVSRGSAPETAVAQDTAFVARSCGGPWVCYVRR